MTEANAASSVPATLTVNGTRHALTLDSRSSLLDVLRDRLDLIGTQKGCDHGQCGACGVLLEGRRTVTCLTLAVMTDGVTVTTVEGLAKDGTLHPLQQAFNRSRCLPVREGMAKAPDEIRELMSGQVIFVGEPDDIVNPLGIKGLGEIGIVGIGAAIGNAVYHATGKRVRDLPIILDKLGK